MKCRIAGYFCINLQHRRDRYHSFMDQMAKTRSSWIAPIQENIRPGVYYASFADIQGPLPRLAPYLEESEEGTRLGAIGCAHAHLRVLEEIAALNTDRWYVVFEDDVSIESRVWLTILAGLRVPSGYEQTNIVMVDLLGERLVEDQIEPQWFRLSRTFPNYHGAHCYVVFGSQAARDVLNAVERHPYLEDPDPLLILCGKSLGWYPGVVGTKEMGTDRLRSLG